MEDLQVQGLKFHHIGCLTEDIEKSIGFYRDALGFTSISKVYSILKQEVKVCFVQTGANVFIEFVEPIAENAALRKILKSKNPYYHVGYTTDNIENAINVLEQKGCYLVNRFVSEAFQNKTCAFMYTDDMQLIELIQN